MSESISITTIKAGMLETNCYILKKDKSIWVVDPGGDTSTIKKRIETMKEAKLEGVVFTHGHIDHTHGIKDIYEEGINIAVHQKDEELYNALDMQADMFGWKSYKPPKANILLKEGDEILNMKVIHTPGHSPGGLCLYGDDMLISGDTLFKDGYGRYDLWGGSFSKLKKSLNRLVDELPFGTMVYPGHGDFTTIGDEASLIKSL